MYKDKRIGLIASFIMATLWNILFNSMRFHLGVPALFIGFLAIYIFWQGYERREKIFGKINPKWAIPLVSILMVLVYSIRRGYFLIGAFIFLYVIFTKKFKTLIKDKYNWIALFIFIALFIILEKFIFISGISEIAPLYYTEIPFNLRPLGIFSGYFSSLTTPLLSSLLYLFYLGFALVTLRTVLSFGYIKKTLNREIRANLFTIVMICTVMAYFLFYQMPLANFGEPRWYFPMLLGCFICIAKGGVFISDYIRKYNKKIAVIVLVVLIGFGGYYELQHADMIIKAKIPSFEGIKQAGLYIKENSNPEDIVISVPKPQPSYYAERQVMNPAMLLDVVSNFNVTLDDFLLALKENEKVRYVIVTFSEPNHPDWMRVDRYAQDPNTGQTMLARWEIPFANTIIDFTTGEQDIKRSIGYTEYGITFELKNVFSDAFVYEVIRS